MTVLTIGRAGRDVGTIHLDPDGRSMSGNTLSLAGTLYTDTQEEVLALAQQVTGLTDSADETVVPITFSDDPTLDGFYAPLSTKVDLEGRLVAGGSVRWSGSFERLHGHAYPAMQSLLTVFARTNSLSASGASGCWWSCPGSAYTPEFALNGASSLSGIRTSADGAMRYIANFSAAGNYVADWPIAPADYYRGAAKLEVGTNLRVVAGRQVDRVNGSPRYWRLSNGLVRVTPNQTLGRLDVATYDGAQWDTAKTYGIYSRTFGTAVTTWTSFRVLYNGPERVSIRLTGNHPASSANDYATFDLTLRRGARHVEVYCVGALPASTATWQIRRMTVEAGTTGATTGSLRALNNDADGNRYVISSPDTCTADTTNGYYGLTTAARSASFGIGAEVGGSAAVGADTAQTVTYDHIFMTAERQIVVGR